MMSTPVHAASETFLRPVDARRLWPIAALAGGGLAGLAAGIQPQLAVVAIVAAAFVPIVFTWPIVGLCTLVFFSFFESLSGASGSLSATKIVGLLLVLVWLGTAATALSTERARRGLVAREPVLAAALVLFTAWAALSLVWAERPTSAASALSSFALNFVLFPIALVAVRTPRHVVALFAVFIASAVAAGVFGMLNPPADAEGRLSGVGLNPNQLGQLLAVAVILAATLATNRQWPLVVRLLALSASVFAAIALYETLSRGALVALGVALLVAPFAVGRGRRAGALVLVIAALVGTVGWFGAVAPESATQRITHPQEEGGSGREDLWRVGWRMVGDHPVQGVGVGNFPVSSIHYLLRPGVTRNDQFIVDTPKVPHNIYLQVLSELGVIGLVLFVLILVASLRCALLAARAFARRNERMMEILARSLFISLVGLLAAEFFSSQLLSKQLWLLLATAPALRAIAEYGGRPEGAPRAGVTRLDWRARARAAG